MSGVHICHGPSPSLKPKSSLWKDIQSCEHPLCDPSYELLLLSHTETSMCLLQSDCSIRLAELIQGGLLYDTYPNPQLQYHSPRVVSIRNCSLDNYLLEPNETLFPKRRCYQVYDLLWTISPNIGSLQAILPFSLLRVEKPKYDTIGNHGDHVGEYIFTSFTS